MDVGTNVDANPASSDRPFRSVSSEFYYFGYDDSAKVKNRLIVKERDQKNVREYDVEEDGTRYYCIGCLKKSQTKKYAYFDDNRFLLVPTSHNCSPIPVVESEFDQEMKMTMFLQAQSEPRASMSHYTSSAMGNDPISYTNTQPSDIIPTTLIKPSRPSPEVTLDGATRGMNKFSAALLDMSTSSSPEYIPETSPSTSAPLTPLDCPASNLLLSNNVVSPMEDTHLLQTQPLSHDVPSEISNEVASMSGVEGYNTAETPLEIRHMQKSDKERKCAETPDSVYGHYLFNGFAGANQTSKNLDRSEFDTAATPGSSTTLNDTLTVDVSCTTPSKDDNIAIPPGGYEYGYSWRTGTANKRVIVFEPNDKTKVKQYAGNGSYFWFCIDCFRIKKRKFKAYFEGDTFMAAKTHFCEPILYDVAKHQQQEIIEKFGINKAKSTPASRDAKSTPASGDVVQSITEMGQESDNDNESHEPSRTSKRVRIAKDRGSSEIVTEEPPTYSLPDYAYLNSLEKRQVKPEDYQYGVGFKNQPNGRIIVFEENDRSFCREYSKDHRNTWYCCYCLRSNKKLYAYMRADIFCVPPEHSCKPKSYTTVMQDQQEIRDRYAVANSNQSLLSPGITLSNVVPVKPGASSALPSPRTPISIDRSPRTRSIRSQSSSMSARPPPPPNVLPVASIEVPVKPVTENQVRTRQRTVTPKTVISQTPKSTFIPVFSNTSQPTTQGTSSKYREVDATDYQYGYNEHGDVQKRLIVFEEDRRFCREYNKTETDRWKCVNCKYGVARKDDDKFFVTFKHECNPISVRKSSQLQSEYKSKAIAQGKLNCDGDRGSVASMSSKHAAEDGNETASHDFNLREKRPSSTSAFAINSSLREVPNDEWEYGFDTAGEKEKRIIVFEPNTNHVYAREFRNDAADTRCLGCAKDRRLHARWYDNKLFVPYNDAHICEPRLYEDIQRKQEKIEFGKTTGRNADRILRSKRARVTAEDTDTSNSPVAGDYDDSYDTSEPPEPKKSRIIRNDNTNVQQRFSAPKVYGPSNTLTTVNYYNPSAFAIAQCCKKLNIKYSPEAYTFWSNIDFNHISSSSRPTKTFPTKESMYHGFSCFSLYLTGNESNTILIREMINRFVYNNFKTLGHCMGHDFSQLSHETPLIRDTLWSFSLTEVHLECISGWFDCRIGIYGNGEWKRYGDWDIEDCDVLTFLVEFKNGKYNPILSLSA